MVLIECKWASSGQLTLQSPKALCSFSARRRPIQTMESRPSDTPSIRRLDEKVVNKIAAGEIIQVGCASDPCRFVPIGTAICQFCCVN